MAPKRNKVLVRQRELKKPSGLTKLLFRLPIAIYHAGLGRLLGERFLLLRHRGRKSGTWHETVIEVAGKDARTNSYYVVAAWGEKSDWRQNLRKDPNCGVNVGAKHFEAKARTLRQAEAERVILGYAHQHPRAIKAIAKFMGFDTDGSEEQYQQFARQVPVVELQPKSLAESST